MFCLFTVVKQLLVIAHFARIKVISPLSICCVVSILELRNIVVELLEEGAFWIRVELQHGAVEIAEKCKVVYSLFVADCGKALLVDVFIEEVDMFEFDHEVVQISLVVFYFC